MSHWVCCNSCFLSQSPERKLAVTSCGHVVCSVCYQKGSHGRCVICSAQCQVSPLSDKSSPDIKDLFSDVGVVATRYLTEISKVVIFQARHQKRLMDYYKQRPNLVPRPSVKKPQEGRTELFSQSSGWQSPVFRPPSSFRLSMSSLSFRP
ncbi:putative E3 SUMO-protein ligase RNF212 [Fundulus diaphanus]